MEVGFWQLSAAPPATKPGVKPCVQIADTIRLALFRAAHGGCNLVIREPHKNMPELGQNGQADGLGRHARLLMADERGPTIPCCGEAPLPLDNCGATARLVPLTGRT